MNEDTWAGEQESEPGVFGSLEPELEKKTGAGAAWKKVRSLSR